MKKLLSIAALGSLLAALVLAVAPAWAQNADSRITELENELARLEGEQMELKKEAVAAAAAMPTFDYRPGRGLTITAADRAWSWNMKFNFNADVHFPEGQDGRRNGIGDMYGRRLRPGFAFTTNGGFYEAQAEIDCDTPSTTQERCGNIQRMGLFVHFEQMNPWLPMFQIGFDVPSPINTYDQGSTSSAATFELPMVRRDNGFNTGSHTGMGLGWENLPAPGRLFPGTWNFHYRLVLNGMGSSDSANFNPQSDKADHVVYWNINPFVQSKNKWINGIGASVGVWFSNPDERNATNANNRARLRTQLGRNRLTLSDSGADMDRGLHTFITPGVKYQVGPYKLMVAGGFDRWNSHNGRNTAAKEAGRPGEVGRIEGTYFRLINELFVWSPKGLFTGSATTPKSLLMGYSFERDWSDCGRPNCDETVTAGGAQFRRNRILRNELDFRYFFQSNMTVAVGWQWYDVSNMPTSEQVSVGCSRNTNTVAGKSCNWVDGLVRVAYYF